MCQWLGVDAGGLAMHSGSHQGRVCGDNLLYEGLTRWVVVWLGRDVGRDDVL